MLFIKLIINLILFIMKNKLCALSLILLLISCSDEIQQFDDFIKQTQNENKELTTRSLDTDDHALGFGYDVTGDYLDKYSIRNSVIDIAKLREFDKNSIITSNEVSGKNQYYYGYSSYDYIKEITKKTGVNTSVSCDSIPIVKGNLSFTGSFSKENFTRHELSTKYSYASADICKDVRWLRLAENVDVLSNFLTDKFKRDISNMTSPEQFVKDYGTHVLADITIGGVLRVMYSSSIIKEDDQEKKTKVIKAGLKGVLAKIGLSADVDKTVIENVSTSAENINRTLHLEYKGGDGVGGTYNLETGYPTIDKYSWEKSVTAANAGLTKINWDKAYPIYEFISDPVKREQVKKAVIKYINDSQLSVLQLNPIYEMFAPTMDDRFYAFSWDEVQMQINKWNNEFWGFKGYILAKPGVNTIPIYEMFAPTMNDRFYAFSWNEVQWQINDWKNENWGLRGYILSEPEANTQPIYEMYSPLLNDRFYVWSWEEVQMQISKWDLVYKSIRVNIGISYVFTGMIIFTLYAFCEPMYHMFTTDPKVIDIGVYMLRFLIPSYLLSILLENLDGGLRGVGDVLWPTIFTFGGLFLIRLPWVMILTPIYHKVEILLISYPIAWGGTLLFVIPYYFWKKKKCFNKICSEK